MRCPKCDAPSHQLRVVLTTYTEEQETVRRRCCKQCKHRWYTLQKPERILDGHAIKWNHRGVVKVA